MKSRFHLQRLTLFLMVLLLMTGLTNAQPKQDSLVRQDTLYKEIAQMDSVLFNAVNAGDIDKLKTLFDIGLEFYHDLGGLTNYEQNIENSRKLFGKNGPKRELVPGSMEVYPIKNYGAIQTGAHKFCREKDGKLVDCGTFKFVHIWQKRNGEWKLTRVISYGH